MTLLLSPAKLVLLAVHFAVNADIASLAALAARHGSILRKDLLLRILLTYLPETLQSGHYVDFIRDLESGTVSEKPSHDIDCSAVDGLSEDEAAKRVRKLRLLPLALPEATGEAIEDVVTLFLLRRSYKVDEEAGLLHELPGLLVPFLDHSPCIRTLLVSTILPLLRRNCEYHPQDPIPYTLLGFQQLPDRVAVNLLLSQTGISEAGLSLVGRDLKCLVGPWLLDERRWKHGKQTTSSAGDTALDDKRDEGICPGWDEVLRWLTTQASRSWRVAVNAIQQWDDPGDADLGDWGFMELSGSQRDHLRQSYARAALASAYLVPEASLEALDGAYNIITKVSNLCDLEPISPLASALAVLPPLTEQLSDGIVSARNTTYMRNDLLSASNVLTSPTNASTAFLQAVTLSAHILTKAGCPCTVRKAGELALLKDEREQKAEAAKLIHALGNHGPKTDDKFWVKTRNEILWLSDWGAEDGWGSSEPTSQGIFSQVKREFLEVEFLKALLANTRFTLARSIYEDAPDQPLDRKLLQDTIYATAMCAYDNASNPNRTRGGLKKCDDIIKAFPRTIQKSDPAAKRIEALLQATHALSDYRLVLKQGEPFTPVVLRVHTDPISIVGKILEQNPKSYTQIKDLLSLGARMVEAGLVHSGGDKNPMTPEETAAQRSAAERRITAMCIDAALTEDDFETAYSYVVNRLSSLSASPPSTDEYSWKAALQAGKYRRTARTMRPTHLGTGSANADVRHLEQRIECLATALRIAPAPTLQEILNAYRRAEEELDAALLAEQQQEEEWDARGDSMRGSAMPGAFASSTGAARHSHLAPSSSSRRQHQTAAEEAPMSLFDLSRASVLSAQRNFSALSGLQRSAGFGGRSGGSARSSLDQRPLSPAGTSDGEDSKRVRKRDQLREAAMGTLVSGVGWLVGAQPSAHGQGRE
ncbi:Sec39 domain-containing protein [Madurella fahalii]|uniref:Sec39 domain-containing protein n=1 Tax=Madurella fahalii TaxID=1157608 RepID=A0ABQ0G948_9PEZI